MNLRQLGCALTILLLAHAAFASEGKNFKWENNTLVLDNGVVSRKLMYDDKTSAIRTTELKIDGDKFNHAGTEGDEFSFEINDKVFNGRGGWKVKSVEPVSDERSGTGAAVTLSAVAPNDSGVDLKIIYLLYPNSPTIRKRLVFTNTSKEEIKVESVDVERFWMTSQLSSAEPYTIYNNYGRNEYVGPYVGNEYDCIVVVHNIPEHNGIVLGNEAPGFLKRTTCFADGNHVSIGLTHKDQKMPFRKWVKPGESWESSWSFICLYNKSSKPYDALFGPVADYVRKYMGLHVATVKYKPQFLYDTFVPFGDHLADKMALQLGKAVAAGGARDYLLDAGWHRNQFGPVNGQAWSQSCGDWLTDMRKFPRGMGPFFNDIKGMGLNPGVWMSMADVGASSKVYRDHPEWLVRDENGQPLNLHLVRPNMYSDCIASGWYDSINADMLKYIKEGQIKYFMIDLAFVEGCYRFDNEIGCYAKGHMHKDHEESYWVMYEQAWKLLDEIHAEYPDVFIDFSYEAMGAYQLIDLDMLKHADGCWYVNCGEKPPEGTLRVRNLSWWTTSAIPAESLSMGNLSLEFPEIDLMVTSMSGTFPVVLGDVRKVPAERLARSKQWADWLAAAEKKHGYLLYRQDLSGFGQPMEGSWDGFQRINTETQSGGIVGVFRQGAKEMQRTVVVERLKPEAIYEIRRGPEGTSVAKMSGKDLAEKGFAVQLDKQYDGADFEVDEVK